MVKDRLAAYIHWKDTQSLVQAVAVMLKHELTPNVFRAFIEREGSGQDYALLQSLFSAGRQGEVTMTALETYLADILLQQP
ncbi:hypothetical protein A3224_13815 [Microbulbifer thermotolerans]|uniref:Uncharacterized protein n=1 Tax=Microbulbifer thermotolerans TaxID=252514 RepID=A0A143HP44_MICTH|nr:hypothetical protein A3224_13815 [Microbulbifer thermotolerans]